MFNIKRLIIVMVIGMLAIFTSCSIPSMFNPDSYGRKNDNTFVFFKPSNLDTLYVSEYGEDLGSESLNGIEYDVFWEEEGGNVKIISYYQPIHELYLTGLSGDRADWVKSGDTISISGIEMEPMENGYYRLMLYEDLTR